MKVFFSDSDNTLIYSHRHKISEDKIVAEYLGAKQQSFMNKEVFNALASLHHYVFVPVTTRSEEQYRRIHCLNDLHPRFALVCNGAKLLVDGKVDSAWEEKTLALANPNMGDFEFACKLLSGLVDSSHYHRPEVYMAYVVIEDPKSVCESFRNKLKDLSVDVAYDSRKVYLFPKGMDKGLSIRRFKKRFQVQCCIGAGDSEMDVPMLNEVDHAFCAFKISTLVQTRKTSIEGEDISLEIARNLIMLDGKDYD